MERMKTVDECEGCPRKDGEFCNTYFMPGAWWKKHEDGTYYRQCPFAPKTIEEVQTKFVNPLKWHKKRR